MADESTVHAVAEVLRGYGLGSTDPYHAALSVLAVVDRAPVSGQQGVLVPRDLAQRLYSYAANINYGGNHSNGYRERALVDADALAVLLDGPVAEET